MAELTPLAIAVLALLEERQMHAYEMYQLLLQRRNDRIVKLRPGSLYHTVERLAGQELVRAIGTDRAGNRPERTTYAITPAGHEALAQRVQSGIETYVYEYPVFPVVLAEIHNLDRADAMARLRCRAAAVRQAITEYEQALAEVAAREVPEPFWLAGTYNRNQLTAELDWLHTTIDRIESKDLPWSHHDSKR